MEENFRSCMMPAWEKFIKVVSASFPENSSKDCNLWRLELVIMRAVAALAVEALVVLRELAHGQGYEGARRACPGCGGVMRFERYRRRQMISSFGPFVYARAYYHCRECQQGYSPLDKRLGIW